MKSVLALLVVFALLSLQGAASYNEASGVVTNVVDGDTFDIRIDESDPRIIDEIERVRLADVDSPEMSTLEGKEAKVYTTEALLGERVWLDIDDKAKDGRGPYDRLICVVYLEDGTNFNKAIVDAGFAEVKDYSTNEFDPDDWW